MPYDFPYNSPPFQARVSIRLFCSIFNGIELDGRYLCFDVEGQNRVFKGI